MPKKPLLKCLGIYKVFHIDISIEFLQENIRVGMNQFSNSNLNTKGFHPKY